MHAPSLLLAALGSIAACSTSAPNDTSSPPDAAVTCPTELASGSACTHEAQSCPIEGTGTCDQEPAGGTCTCTNGTWTCQSGCADGCPMQHPAENAACTLVSGTDCRYYYPAPTTCTCTNNAFHCL